MTLATGMQPGRACLRPIFAVRVVILDELRPVLGHGGGLGAR